MRRSKITLTLKPSSLPRHRQPGYQEPDSGYRIRNWGHQDLLEHRYLSIGENKLESLELNLTESEERHLMIRLEELARLEGLREGTVRTKIPSSTQALIDSKAGADEVIKNDGSVPLSDDWDIGDGRNIRTDGIRARDQQGLKLYDDDGNGIFVKDGGYVGIGMTTPGRRIDILDTVNPQLRLTHTDGSVYTEFETDSSGHLTIDPTGGEVIVDAIVDFTATMGNSSKDPTSDAPDDWIEVKIGTTTGYVPWYTA